MRCAIWIVVFAVVLAPGVVANASPTTCHLVVNHTGNFTDNIIGDGLCATNAAYCTLRAALQEANAQHGCTITFDFTGNGPHVINPLSPLPAIEYPVTIDGTSEAVYTATGLQPMVVVNGRNVVEPVSTPPSVQHADDTGESTSSPTEFVIGRAFLIKGLASSGSHIQGLVLNEWQIAIVVFRSSNNVIQNNYIGTDETGTTARPNVIGLLVSWGYKNLVGGASQEVGNLISGNTGPGVKIVNQSHHNSIFGNRIGTTADGLASQPNHRGILLDQSRENIIGQPSSGNVISGNTKDGISISGGNTNAIRANLIGTDSVGAGVIGNGACGISILNSPSTIIGGSGDHEGNRISGNTNGITVQKSNDTRILGNIIGGLPETKKIFANSKHGIWVTNSASTTISHNNISGNGKSGVDFFPQVKDSLLDGNIITLNGEYGITSFDSDHNIFVGNSIGTDLAGASELGNAAAGIRIAGSKNRVGGTLPGEGNVIVSNNTGIDIAGLSSESAYAVTSENIVIGNYIGITGPTGALLPNAGLGIRIYGSQHNVIGGIEPDAGNTIVGGTWSGIRVHEPTDSAASTVDNSLLGNRIYMYATQGIDLEPDGMTWNDTADTDTGPNHLQNYPVITHAQLNNGLLTIGGSLQSTSNTTYRLEFFVDVKSATAMPQARHFVGTQDVRIADGAAFGLTNIAVVFSVPSVVNTLNAPFLSATATVCDDPNTDGLCDGNYGDTSELSQPIGVEYEKPTKDTDLQKQLQHNLYLRAPKFMRKYFRPSL